MSGKRTSTPGRSVAVFALVLTVISLAAGAGLLLWARGHGFSARVKPTAFEAALAGAVRRLAVPPAVRNLSNPVQISPILLAEARDHFADHCALCHGNDGSGRTPINEGLYPPAPDLRGEGTQVKTDGELFHAIREGVRFTGMPGWGGEDEENWTLVNFVRHLPNLTPEELEYMREVNHLPSESRHPEAGGAHRGGERE